MTQMQEKKYSICRHGQEHALRVKIFRNWNKLVNHVEDHFFNDKEFWDRVFPRRLLDTVRKKWPESHVISSEFYTAIVDAIDEGIRFSLELPMYAWAEQEVDGNRRECMYCIAKQGFVMVLDTKRVRSAYFPVTYSDCSAYTLFRTSWQDISHKLRKAEYVDDKARHAVKTLSREWVSPDNWALCPNPHAKPKIKARSSNASWRITTRQYLGSATYDE